MEGKGNRLYVIAYGTIKTDTSKNLPEKLGELFKGFNEIIVKYSPDEVAVENIFTAENPRSALLLGQARAAVMLPAVNSGIPVYEYSALQVKKAVTGHGKAEKGQVAEMVRRLLSLKAAPKPADITDALGVAICHIHSAPALKRMALK